MYDTHAHLTIQPLYDNLTSAIEKFKELDGKKILNVSYDEESIQLIIQTYNQLAHKFPETLLNGLGIHPEYYTDIYQDDDQIQKKYLKIIENLNKSVGDYKNITHAIGETGLDYYHLDTPTIKEETKDLLMEIQKNSFRDHIVLALKYELPLVIHCRDVQGSNRAIQDALGILANIGKGKVSGIFHSYTQGLDFLQDILAMGFLIGFNGIITYPKAENVREILLNTPIDKIVLETDAPFLPPQEVRNDKKALTKYAMPHHVDYVAKKISEILGLTEQEVKDQTDKNFERLFFLD